MTVFGPSAALCCPDSVLYYFWHFFTVSTTYRLSSVQFIRLRNCDSLISDAHIFSTTSCPLTPAPLKTPEEVVSVLSKMPFSLNQPYLMQIQQSDCITTLALTLIKVTISKNSFYVFTHFYFVTQHL